MSPSTLKDPRGTFEMARLRLARLRVQGGNSLQSVFWSATETAAATLQVERVGIWLLIDDRRAIRCFHLYERTKREHSEGAILHAEYFPTYFRALEEWRAIPAAIATTDPLTHELREAYLEPLGIVSMLDAPIFRAGQVVGVVCHEQVGTPRQWTNEERDFAASVADLVALQFEEAARQDAEASLRAREANVLDLKKSEALSQLARGVAHDFKNSLHGVLGFAQLIWHDPSATAPIKEYARQILDAAEHGAALAQELLHFGRDEVPVSTVIDVSHVVRRFTGMLTMAAKGACRVNVVLPATCGRVFIARAQLERVLLNLTINARDAMPEGGVIEIEVSETRVVEGIETPSVYIVLQVRDHGCGMDASTQAHLFEPFFTTKPKGKGTGLGLAAVQQIVEHCGGFIHVESQLGKGTTIRVYLPRIACEP